MSNRFGVLVMCALLVGCAASAGGSGQTRSSSNVLLRAEIEGTGVTNLHDAIQQLRPQFLRTRGNTSIMGAADQIKVYLNGTELGGISTLQTIQASSVERVEFVRGPDTAVRFGLDNPAGVIAVTLTSGGR